MKVTIQGSEGSFNEEAALTYLESKKIEEFDIDYSLNTSEVLQKITENQADLGVFAVYNNNSGIVEESFNAMGKYNFTFVEEFMLSIIQCLHVKPGTSIENIRRVISHPQALAQCSNYLGKYLIRAKIKEGLNTAEEVKNLMNGKYDDKVTAVIASIICEYKYGSKVLVDGVQNSDDNFTSFCIVKK